ncbi:MAG: DUF2088 domain-containing protein [Thermoplasmata archaeon]|nr:DUF2088 domain-containing protein [Thermoplasmata archaeon]
MKGNIEMETINPRGTLSPIGESEIFKEFDNLVGSKFANLVDFFEASRFLFIVNDQDRSTPTARIIKHMDNHLKAKGGDLRSKDVHVILATGSHGPPKEEELIQILGDYYDILKPRIIIHSAKECDSELIGTSERGTPINVNRLILGYDRILTINSIEPHYFAGYTGGRKSIVPGICHYDTIEANHKMAMDENSRILALKGNPVHEDMMEITNIIVNHLRTLGTDVNAIACVESGGEIYGLSAGDIKKS